MTPPIPLPLPEPQRRGLADETLPGRTTMVPRPDIAEMGTARLAPSEHEPLTQPGHEFMAQTHEDRAKYLRWLAGLVGADLATMQQQADEWDAAYLRLHVLTARTNAEARDYDFLKRAIPKLSAHVAVSRAYWTYSIGEAREHEDAAKWLRSLRGRKRTDGGQ